MEDIRESKSFLFLKARELGKILSTIPLDVWNRIVANEPEAKLLDQLPRYGFGKFATLMVMAALNDYQLKGPAEENGYRPYLVFTYGKKVWSVVKPTMSGYGMDPEDYVIVGREIYDKLLGVGEDYYDLIIEKIVREVQAEDLEFSKAVEQKKQQLLKELKDRYGDDIIKLLKDLT